MTAYFDTRASTIRDLCDKYHNFGEDEFIASGALDTLDAVEKELVWDTTLCAEWPGCPENIRDAIHRTVLRYAPGHQPTGIRGNCESTWDHLESIRSLCETLHTIFHSLGAIARELKFSDFSDDPKRPLYNLFGAGQDRREDMSPVPLAYWKAQIESFSEEEKEPARERIAERVYKRAEGLHGVLSKKALVAKSSALLYLRGVFQDENENDACGCCGMPTGGRVLFCSKICESKGVSSDSSG